MVLTVAADVADPAACPDVIEQGLAMFGRVDTLVDNAGVVVAKPFTDYTGEDYELAGGVNLRGLLEISKRAVGARRSRAWGCGVAQHGSVEWHSPRLEQPEAARGIRTGTVELTLTSLNPR